MLRQKRKGEPFVKPRTILLLNLLLACVGALEIALMLSLPVVSQEAPEALFKGKCAMCHGADAAGKTSMGEKLKIPDLRAPDTQKKSDADLKVIMTKGKDKMPAYETKLSSAQIDSLTAYIRGLGKK
jgi:mono/diheme cytochrome c family protein